MNDSGQFSPGAAILGVLLWVSISNLIALPGESDGWIRAKTSHFTMIGNADQRRMARIGTNLERLREVLSHTTAGTMPLPHRPIHVYVFRDSESFAPYDSTGDGRSANRSGYFIGSRDGDYIAVDASAGTEPFSVVYHEYMHGFLRRNLRGLPLWMSEGLAELFSTFEVRGGRAEIGQPIDHHLYHMSRHPLIPLDELFALDTSSPDYNEGVRRGTIYAQSWALTHYLLVDPDRRPGLGRFMRLLDRGLEPIAAFESAYATELGTVEQELTRYVRRESFPFYAYTPQKALTPTVVSLQPLDYREVLSRLGDLLAHYPSAKSSGADEFLRAALAIDGAQADTHASLAWLKFRERDLSEAADHCRKALRLDADNARVHSLFGRVLLRSFVETREGDGGDERTLLEARRHFRRSLSLAPGDADNLADLGKTFVFGREEDLASGIEVLSRACAARPARSDILLDLIAVTARYGRGTDARRLLDERLRPRRDAERVRAAEAIIAEVDLERAVRLYNRGHHEEAEALVRETTESVRDPGLKAALSTELASFSSRRTRPGS